MKWIWSSEVRRDSLSDQFLTCSVAPTVVSEAQKDEDSSVFHRNSQDEYSYATVRELQKVSTARITP